MDGEPILKKGFYPTYTLVSPDGRWLAYQSNESGQIEIYVRPFPDVNQERSQISTNGGDSPLWPPDGDELFYRSGDSFMAVEVETEPAFKLGNSEVLFRGAFLGNSESAAWDIHPDGKRFLMIKPPETTEEESTSAGPRKINIVLNWFEELKERVPVE